MAVSVMLMMRTASRWNLSLLTRVKYRSKVIVKVTLENIVMDIRNRRSFSRQRNIDSWRSFGQEKSSQGLPAPEGQERVPVLSRSNQVSSDQFFSIKQSLQFLAIPGKFFLSSPRTLQPLQKLAVDQRSSTCCRWCGLQSSNTWSLLVNIEASMKKLTRWWRGKGKPSSSLSCLPGCPPIIFVIQK